MADLCSGCGAIGEHPWVGIGKDEESGTWAAFPVCDRCFRDPAHRQRVLKYHFAPKAQAAIALAHAGSATLGM